MPHSLRALLAGPMFWLLLSVGHAQIQLAGVSEVRGAGTAAGSSFKNGYLMAIDEINAGGGVLGQKFVLAQFDIDTKADDAVEATQKAIALKPFAILGPIFSGITAAVMPQTVNTGILHFTGGEAASLTRKFHPTLLRTSLSQLGSVPRMASVLTYGLGARKVGLLWIDNEFGRDARAVLIDVVKRRNASVGFDLAIKPAQTDFVQAVRALKEANVDALLLYLNESESVDALKELKAQGFGKPIVADGLVASQKVIDGAGSATDGVLAHVNTYIDVQTPQMLAFVERYTARYKVRPDQNSFKGYFSVQLTKAAIEESKTPNQAMALKIIKDFRFDVRRYPEVLSSVSYDFFGDLNRDSYIVMIRDARPRLVAVIHSTEGGMVELPGGRQITFNSNEFRRELSSSMVALVAPASKVNK